MSSDMSGKRDAGALLFIRAALVLAVLVTIYPMIFVFLTSVKTTNEFYNNIWLLPSSFAWENYAYAWNIARIGEYFLSSVIVVSVTVCASLALGALAGYALAKLRVPGADAILIGIFLLTMLPSESIIMPMYIMMSRAKLTGTYPSLILPYIGWGLALTIYIYRNFFMTVPGELIEAARMDGCGETRTFLQVVMPVMLPATATNAIFLFLAGGAKCCGPAWSCPPPASKPCRWASPPLCKARAPTGARCARPAALSSFRF